MTEQGIRQQHKMGHMKKSAKKFKTEAVYLYHIKLPTFTTKQTIYTLKPANALGLPVPGQDQKGLILRKAPIVKNFVIQYHLNPGLCFGRMRYMSLTLIIWDNGEGKEFLKIMQ